MFSRKSFDAKKHPFKGKDSRSPKPYKRERVEKFMKDSDIYTKRRNVNG